MSITGVHHASVAVSDMQRSWEFYRGTLGMRQELEIRYDADPVMMDLPGSEPRQHLVLLSAGNAYVELIHSTWSPRDVPTTGEHATTASCTCASR